MCCRSFTGTVVTAVLEVATLRVFFSVAQSDGIAAIVVGGHINNTQFSDQYLFLPCVRCACVGCCTSLLMQYRWSRLFRSALAVSLPPPPPSPRVHHLHASREVKVVCIVAQTHESEATQYTLSHRHSRLRDSGHVCPVEGGLVTRAMVMPLRTAPLFPRRTPSVAATGRAHLQMSVTSAPSATVTTRTSCRTAAPGPVRPSPVGCSRRAGTWLWWPLCWCCSWVASASRV